MGRALESLVTTADRFGPSAGDAALAQGLRAGEHAALAALHRRYAALVYTVAFRALGSAAADDVVQDVFAALWQSRDSCDPARDSLRPWIMKFARNRIANVLRARKSTLEDALESKALAADTAAPDEALWQARRRAALREAWNALPEAQQQALRLAYLDELSAAQVAASLRVPTGTVKTRIRLGLRRLLSALAVLSALVFAGTWFARRERAFGLQQRALRMVTASEVVPVYIPAAPGIPSAAHGRYRARDRDQLAVLTASHLPASADGAQRIGWVRYGDTWSRLGPLVMREDGRGMVIAEVAIGGAPREVLLMESTVEDSRVPEGRPILRWASDE